MVGRSRVPGQPSVEPHTSIVAGGAPAPPLVGVLTLDTGFARWPRDIGQGAGLPFAVRHRCVARATVQRVVSRQALPASTREAFIAAGRALVEEGATLVTTSCGFLYREQCALSRALPVPVVSSALVALDHLHAVHGARGAVGILSFDAAALGPITTGDGAPCVVQGLPPDGHFRAVVEERCDRPEPMRLRAEAVAAARRLAEHSPAVVLLECTNLAPWRQAIQALFSVPVIDLVDVIGWSLPSRAA